MNIEQKALVFDKLCGQIEKQVEEEIPNWLSENPVFEVDDDDGEGNRTFHYPPTKSSDARDALIESTLRQAEDMGLYDFFEAVICDLYGKDIPQGNFYKPIQATQPQTNNVMQDICYSFVSIPELLANKGAL